MHAADVQPGDTVIVVGIGGIGINAVQGAAQAGARVVAVDPVPFKREHRAEPSAPPTRLPPSRKHRNWRRELTYGVGADHRWSRWV